MAGPESSILSLRGMSSADFDLRQRDVALVEADEDEMEAFLDLCIGLVDEPRGEVWCLGVPWHTLDYRERLARRSRLGILAGSQVWPAHLPVAQVALAPRLYHGTVAEADVVDEATVLARRFGLPGLPIPTRETVHPGDLVRTACVRAFLGAPDLVVIADSVLDAMPELALPLAQSIGTVQDRGGAVLWLLGSRGAPAARFVKPDQVLRLANRVLSPIGRWQ
jgi:phospholipid/cholesterol/gamma-HCH transport system ATP-binding protein